MKIETPIDLLLTFRSARSDQDFNLWQGELKSLVAADFQTLVSQNWRAFHLRNEKLVPTKVKLELQHRPNPFSKEISLVHVTEKLLYPRGVSEDQQISELAKALAFAASNAVDKLRRTSNRPLDVSLVEARVYGREMTKAEQKGKKTPSPARRAHSSSLKTRRHSPKRNVSIH